LAQPTLSTAPNTVWSAAPHTLSFPTSATTLTSVTLPTTLNTHTTHSNDHDNTDNSEDTVNTTVEIANYVQQPSNTRGRSCRCSVGRVIINQSINQIKNDAPGDHPNRDSLHPCTTCEKKGEKKNIGSQIGKEKGGKEYCGSQSGKE